VQEASQPSPIGIRGMPISGAPSMIIVIAAVPTAPAAIPRPRLSSALPLPSHAWLVLC